MTKKTLKTRIFAILACVLVLISAAVIPSAAIKYSPTEDVSPASLSDAVNILTYRAFVDYVQSSYSVEQVSPGVIKITGFEKEGVFGFDFPTVRTLLQYAGIGVNSVLATELTFYPGRGMSRYMFFAPDTFYSGFTTGGYYCASFGTVDNLLDTQIRVAYSVTLQDDGTYAAIIEYPMITLGYTEDPGEVTVSNWAPFTDPEYSSDSVFLRDCTNLLSWECFSNLQYASYTSGLDMIGNGVFALYVNSGTSSSNVRRNMSTSIRDLLIAVGIDPSTVTDPVISIGNFPCPFYIGTTSYGKEARVIEFVSVEDMLNAQIYLSFTVEKYVENTWIYSYPYVVLGRVVDTYVNSSNWPAFVDMSDVPVNSIYQSGYDAGIFDGFKDGFELGYDSGYQEGYDSGYQEGYDSGYQAGESLVITSPTELWTSLLVTIDYYVGDGSDRGSEYYVVEDGLVNTVYDVDVNNLYDSEGYLCTKDYIDDVLSRCGPGTDGFDEMTKRVPVRIRYEFSYDNVQLVTNSYNYDVRFVADEISRKPYFYVNFLCDGNLFHTQRASISSVGSQKLYFGVDSAHATTSILIDQYGNNDRVGLDEGIRFKIIGNDILSAYQDGFTAGQENGRDLGYSEGTVKGYQNGFTAGKKEGLMISELGDWRQLFLSVTEAPINTFQSLFNFEILGLDMRAAFGSILALCVLLFIIKKVIT